MDISKYVESMKNLPNRFSNLAFWRGVRKLKDKLVETFEYVGEWGNGIEGQILDINVNIGELKYSNQTRDSRISELESSDVNLNTEITNIKSNITTLENTDQSLDSRISSLENAGGGGTGSGSGALIFNSTSKSFTPTTIEVLASNLDVSDAGTLIVPYPKVVYARIIGILDGLEANSLIVNALMSGHVAVSKGTQYSNTVQFTDEPMYAVRVNDTSYKLYTAWIPFTTTTKEGFNITIPTLSVNYTTANMG